VAGLGEVLSLGEARRVALAAQGFGRPRPRRPGIRDLRRVIHGLGLVQIDFVNVLLPAHYLVPFSRLGPYDRSKLDDLVYRRGEFTEQFAHEASIVPIEAWPLVHRAGIGNDRRTRALSEFMARHENYAAHALEEIRVRGPLTAKELPDPDHGRRRSPDVWNWWSVPRAALEGLYARGVLAVVGRRPDFSRVFDLTERAIPDAHLEREIGREEARRELLRRAAACMGIATVADLADYYRMPIRDTRPHVDALLAEGQLRVARVDGWREPAYLHADAGLPKSIEAAALISPFDPVVWFRRRTARLFDFDYRIEIFVPNAGRRWGYYVLPFLLGERLAARVDLKAERSSRRLSVIAAYIEDGFEPSTVARALATELECLASWLELGSVIVGRRGNLARRLGSLFR